MCVCAWLRNSTRVFNLWWSFSSTHGTQIHTEIWDSNHFDYTQRVYLCGKGYDGKKQENWSNRITEEQSFFLDTIRHFTYTTGLQVDWPFVCIDIIVWTRTMAASNMYDTSNFNNTFRRAHKALLLLLLRFDKWTKKNIIRKCFICSLSWIIYEYADIYSTTHTEMR